MEKNTLRLRMESNFTGSLPTQSHFCHSEGFQSTPRSLSLKPRRNLTRISAQSHGADQCLARKNYWVLWWKRVLGYFGGMPLLTSH